MSISPQSELSSDEHSFMETEYFQTDVVPSLVEDEALQNMSDEGVPEDCEDVLFDVISELQYPKTVSNEGNPEDYEGLCLMTLIMTCIIHKVSNGLTMLIESLWR